MATAPSQAFPGAPPLPEGWTEHRAPDGRVYYYHASSKKSTYVRPLSGTVPVPPAHQPFGVPPYSAFAAAQDSTQPSSLASHRQSSAHWKPNDCQQPEQQRKRPPPADRPKKSTAIPNCAPWLLVSTRLGRRFVHNPETGDSLWKFPEQVMRAVIDLDAQRRTGSAPGLSDSVRDKGVSSTESAVTKAISQDGIRDDQQPPPGPDRQSPPHVADAEEAIEEVEIIEEDEEEEQRPADRPDGAAAEPEELGDLEFGLDDLEDLDAIQADAMSRNESAAEDPNADSPHSAGAATSEVEAQNSFFELLDDHGVSPFATWDAIVDAGQMVGDFRYALLPNMKARKDAFTAWSSDRIRRSNEQKKEQASQNPRIPFLAFLQTNASSKLFWPEFKRKFKAAPEIRDTAIPETEREKLYREHVKRVKTLSQDKLQLDLKALLQSISPSSAWNRSSSLDATLPSALVSDIRYYSVKPKIRGPLMAEFIKTLPAPSAVMSEERASLDQKREARGRQEAALRQRQSDVLDAKRSAQRKVAAERQRLEINQEEIQRALHVSRAGLKASLD